MQDKSYTELFAMIAEADLVGDNDMDLLPLMEELISRGKPYPLLVALQLAYHRGRVVAYKSIEDRAHESQQMADLVITLRTKV